MSAHHDTATAAQLQQFQQAFQELRRNFLKPKQDVPPTPRVPPKRMPRPATVPAKPAPVAPMPSTPPHVRPPVKARPKSATRSSACIDLTRTAPMPKRPQPTAIKCSAPAPVVPPKGAPLPKAVSLSEASKQSQRPPLPRKRKTSAKDIPVSRAQQRLWRGGLSIALAHLASRQLQQRGIKRKGRLQQAEDPLTPLKQRHRSSSAQAEQARGHGLRWQLKKTRARPRLCSKQKKWLQERIARPGPQAAQASHVERQPGPDSKAGPEQDPQIVKSLFRQVLSEERRALPKRKALTNLQHSLMRDFAGKMPDPAKSAEAREATAHLEVKVEVGELFFSLRTVSQTFQLGKHAGKDICSLETAEGKEEAGLCEFNGGLLLSKLPPLVVVKHRGKQWVICGNRRLKALKN
eukprot:CAMPEP_0197702984 /NCGR_PEP_ID=MMETSP1338-20131121/125195_1 /TAXON_ID=43686 ORGANISM="Pelagodinium beii, Strain RCC1491" /NCGR_SAMPLE_ID=MMETSP1338 /ASSEMBLY_ACC=CAM_ASM_000754 /LENGTH=405 /DNA_ID=CAMNT_0043286875 /DNA_START=78 /DNA_END=1292 /DNA_ORIENTATION=+